MSFGFALEAILVIGGFAVLLLAIVALLGRQARRNRGGRPYRRDGGVGVSGDGSSVEDGDRGWFRRWFDSDGGDGGGGDGGGGAGD